ncbi:MAG: hypothetical protein P8J45_12855 [Phycisphaerales bacterium]|jgi:hypothetical protein|nr:hypothetical protein [Phycisphaerales bacterium]
MHLRLDRCVQAIVLLSLPASVACTPYRIEYHKRPAFYKEASEKELLDEVVLDDGTVVRFVESDVNNTLPTGSDDAGATRINDMETRSRANDGTITLRAFSPEHVLGHAKRGIREREYRVLWDQLLAERTKAAYLENGGGFEAFAEFCEENRPAMMETFNRMGFGLFSPDVVQDALGADGIRYRLHPRLAEQFVFTEFDVIREESGMKWAMIR